MLLYQVYTRLQHVTFIGVTSPGCVSRTTISYRECMQGLPSVIQLRYRWSVVPRTTVSKKTSSSPGVIHGIDTVSCRWRKGSHETVWSCRLGQSRVKTILLQARIVLVTVCCPSAHFAYTAVFASNVALRIFPQNQIATISYRSEPKNCPTPKLVNGR